MRVPSLLAVLLAAALAGPARGDEVEDLMRPDCAVHRVLRDKAREEVALLQQLGGDASELERQRQGLAGIEGRYAQCVAAHDPVMTEEQAREALRARPQPTPLDPSDRPRYPIGAIAPAPPPDPPGVARLRHSPPARALARSAEICWRRILQREGAGNDAYVSALEQSIDSMQREIAETHQKVTPCSSRKVKALLRCKELKTRAQPLDAKCKGSLARLFLGW